ncbi:MAG: hypothetical protein FWE45_04410 [Firmicutes bacterium]|nr:hypothetical protein [Bacillota bacterium]
MIRASKRMIATLVAMILIVPVIALPMVLLAGNDNDGPGPGPGPTNNNRQFNMSGLTVNGGEFGELDLTELLRDELRPILLNFLVNAETEDLRELLQPLLVGLVESGMAGVQGTIKQGLLDILQNDQVEGFGEFLTEFLLVFLIENDVASFGEIMTEAVLRFLRSGQIEEAQQFIRQVLIGFLQNDVQNFQDDIRRVILLILESDQLRGVGQIVNDLLNTYFTRAQIQSIMLQLLTPDLLRQLGLEEMLLELVPTELRGVSLRELLIAELPAEFRNMTLRELMEDLLPSDLSNMGFSDLVNDMGLDVVGLLREFFPDDLADVVAAANGCQDTLFATLMMAVMGNLIDLEDELEPNMLPGVGLGQLLELILPSLGNPDIYNLQGEERFQELMRPLMHLMLGMPAMFEMFTDEALLRAEIAPVVRDMMVDMLQDALGGLGFLLGVVMNAIMGPGMVNDIISEKNRNINAHVRDPGMFDAWLESPEFLVWEAEYNAFIATPQFNTYNLNNRQGRTQFLQVLEQNTFLVYDNGMISFPAMLELQERHSGLVFDWATPVIDLVAIEEALLFYPGTTDIRADYNPWFRYFVWHNPTNDVNSIHTNYRDYRNWLVNGGGTRNAGANAFLVAQEVPHIVPTPNETHGIMRWNLNTSRIIDGSAGRNVRDMSLYTLPTFATLQARAVTAIDQMIELAWEDYNAANVSNWVGTPDYMNWRVFANNTARIANRVTTGGGAENVATGAVRNVINPWNQWVAQAPTNLAGFEYRMRPATDTVHARWTTNPGTNVAGHNAFRDIVLNTITWATLTDRAEWELDNSIELPTNFFEFTDLFHTFECGQSLWARGVPDLIDNGVIVLNVVILGEQRMEIFGVIFDMMIPMLLDELPLDGLTPELLVDLVDMVFELYAELKGPLYTLATQMVNGNVTISDAELLVRLLDVLLPHLGGVLEIEFVGDLIADLLTGLLPEPFNNPALVAHLIDTQLDALLELLPVIMASENMHATVMDEIFPLLLEILDDQVLVEFVLDMGLMMLPGLDEATRTHLVNLLLSDVNALIAIITDDEVDCLAVALIDKLLTIMPTFLADEVIQALVPELLIPVLAPVLPEGFDDPALVAALLEELLPLLPELILSEDIVGDLVLELIDLLPILLENEVVFNFFFDILFLDVETWLGDEELRIWWEAVLDEAIANFQDDNWFTTEFDNLINTLVGFLNDEMIDDAFDWVISFLIDAIESVEGDFHHYFATVVNQIIHWLAEDRVIETAWDFMLGQLVYVIENDFDAIFDSIVSFLVEGINNDEMMDTVIEFVVPLLIEFVNNEETFNMVFDMLVGTLLGDIDLGDILGDIMPIFEGISITLTEDGYFVIGIGEELEQILYNEDPMIFDIVISLFSSIFFVERTVGDETHFDLMVYQFTFNFNGSETSIGNEEVAQPVVNILGDVLGMAGGALPFDVAIIGFLFNIILADVIYDGESILLDVRLDLSLLDQLEDFELPFNMTTLYTRIGLGLEFQLAA